MHVFGIVARGEPEIKGHLVMIHPEYKPITDTQMFAVGDVNNDTSLYFVYKKDIFFLDKTLK